MKTRRGYSLVVLVITIAVMIIITSVSVMTITDTKEQRKMINFIADMTSIEEYVQEYYSNTGMLPIGTRVTNLPAGMSAQLNANDGNEYYYIDLNKLDKIHISDPTKAYILNTQSLSIYCEEGIAYKGITYYALTDSLMGLKGNYMNNFVKIQITGNPITWATTARLKASIPSESDFTHWTFKWDFGPKTKEYFLTDGQEFEYGDTLVAKTNGVYSIYISYEIMNEEGIVELVEIIKNVVVSKIDDIVPKIVFENGILYAVDNETGIAQIRFKEQVTDMEGNDQIIDVESYVLNGKGYTLAQLKEDMTAYKKEKSVVEQRWEVYVAEYNALSDDEKIEREAEYRAKEEEKNLNLTALDDQYAYITDPTKRFVVYIEDYAGNGVVALPSDHISLAVLINSFEL